jgi:outer membrane biosynthesis protein TonB
MAECQPLEDRVATKPTIAERVAGIADLSNEDLAALRSDILTVFEETDANEDADINVLTTLAGHMDTVQRTTTERAAAAPAEATEEPPVEVPAETPEPVVETPEPPVETPAEPGVETPSPAVDPEPVAPEAAAAPVETVAEVVDITPTISVEEGTPVAAAAGTEVAVPQGAEPVVAAGRGSRVFVGGGVPGFTAGSELESYEQFGQAMAARVNTLLRLNGGDGERVVIASIKSDVPEDRTLSDTDPFKLMEKIEAVTSPDALVQSNPGTAIVASGGCCAPLVTRYDLWDDGGSTARPVRDSLAGFRADRGGIRFYPGPHLADIQGALGFWTCADDTAADVANSATWKVCADIDCPAEQTAELQAITMCIKFGVLQTRIFPEVAAANTKLSTVAQARVADAALLAQIKAGSYAITDSGTAWGAVRDLMNAIGRASMYYRDRYRLQSAPLRAIMPAWVLEALRTDLLDAPDWGRPVGQHYGVSEDEIRSFFSARNINVTFALDSSAPATNGGGFFTTATGNALPAWPTTVEWALFPEGAWLYLDGGSLDLGVIRDSTLVRVNDYMTFAETFEAAALIGGESLWFTSTIDVSGKYPAAV